MTDQDWALLEWRWRRWAGRHPRAGRVLVVTLFVSWLALMSAVGGGGR